MYIFSISTDSDEKETGWNLFDSDNTKVMCSGSLSAPKNISFIKRSIILTDSLKYIMGNLIKYIDTVCIEEIYYRTNTRKITDLIKLNGIYTYMIYKEFNILSVLVKPYDWISYFNLNTIKNSSDRHYYVIKKINEILNLNTDSVSETYSILISYYYSCLIKGVKESWTDNQNITANTTMSKN